ncbi:unnamed protein product [Arctia plantaginis]|uniref:Uncharacterized protein n=1 Tax=Arctia plantaginis TaxID=874455 RepID=A0A8S1A2V2_ARCPL|nr:unnamed protein product [Arctia plantaginis]
MADRQPAAKIVLKNETFRESTTPLTEITDCIGIKPTVIKPLGRARKIHLLIFDGKHKSRDLLENFETLERKFFCEPSIKVIPFRENRNTLYSARIAMDSITRNNCATANKRNHCLWFLLFAVEQLFRVLHY